MQYSHLAWALSYDVFEKRGVRPGGSGCVAASYYVFFFSNSLVAGRPCLVDKLDSSLHYSNLQLVIIYHKEIW